MRWKKDKRGKHGGYWRCAINLSEAWERWAKANREEWLERKRRYRQENSAKIRAYREANKERQRAWREANIDKSRIASRAWYERLPNYEYNLRLLKARRSKALARMRRRNERSASG